MVGRPGTRPGLPNRRRDMTENENETAPDIAVAPFHPAGPTEIVDQDPDTEIAPDQSPVADLDDEDPS